jgi:hypothetical protein
MKIVIGYDGSEYADAALDDLRCAGLPRDAESLIVSVSVANHGMHAAVEVGIRHTGCTTKTG